MGYWTNLYRAVVGVDLTGDQPFYITRKLGTNFLSHKTHDEKMRMVLTNPAANWIFKLLPDLFSMGKFVLEDANGDRIEEHPYLTMLSTPNPMQSEQQWKWDYMFYKKMGVAKLYVHRPTTIANRLYWLHPDKIEYPQSVKDNFDRLFLSEQSVREFMNTPVLYETKTQRLQMTMGQIVHYSDFSNTITGWWESPSVLDALYKIITNSDNLVSSKNVTSRLAGKFQVSGEVGLENVNDLPMGSKEKASIENILKSKKSIYASRTQSRINRFVENPGMFKGVDESFLNDAFVIGKALNIPRDVIELLSGSTYENQEKARAVIVSYCLSPDAEDLCQGLERKVEPPPGLRLKMVFDHLPYVQVFENEKAQTDDKRATAMHKLIQAGVDQAEAAEAVGFQFENFTEPRFMSNGQDNQRPGQTGQEEAGETAEGTEEEQENDQEI